MIGPAITTGAKLEQRQTLSLKARQSLELLVKPMVELVAQLRTEFATNPCVEDVYFPLERQLSTALPETAPTSPADAQPLNLDPAGAAANDRLLADDSYRDEILKGLENANHDEEAQTRRQHMFDRVVVSETLQDHLMAQLGLSGIAAADIPIAETIVARINDKGYFEGSFADIEMTTGATAEKLRAIQAEIMKLDPPGCGGRNLRECLLAQMEKLDDSPWEDEVRALLENHLPDLENGRTDRICRALKISADDFAKVMAELRTLNPFPGTAYKDHENANLLEKSALYVTPEVTALKNESGKWLAAVEQKDVPRIIISPRYRKMLEDPNLDPESRAYIKEKLDKAAELQEALEERSSTIRKIAQAILDVQGDALDTGALSAIRPLTMQQVSEKVGMHHSTVSRTVNEKYIRLPKSVTTAKGISTRVVLLRDFFTSGVASETGEMVSNKQVKEWIMRIVDGENKAKPLSDDKITQILQERHNMKVARRTVAKYREAIGIPGTAARKKR